MFPLLLNDQTFVILEEFKRVCVWGIQFIVDVRIYSYRIVFHKNLDPTLQQ